MSQKYFIPSEFKFQCIEINDEIANKLRNVMCNVMCHKDISFDNIKTVIVNQNQYMFGVYQNPFKSDELNLIVPRNISYDNNTKLWTIKYKSYLYQDYILLAYYDLVLNDKQLTYILNHESNHYINKDTGFPYYIFGTIYKLTTNPIVLLMSYYFGTIYMPLSCVVYNHLFAYNHKSIEKKADLEFGTLDPSIRVAAADIWEYYSKIKIQYYTFIHKILYDIKDYYDTFICGDTHPSCKERTEYLRLES